MSRLVLIVAGLVFGQAALAAGSAEKGRTAFVRHGCWECHGFQGQGGVTGPRLAPNPLPLEAMSVFVRNTRGAMPPYQKAILSDADLADIHAWLQSLPKAPDYKSIPLLNP
ncbi:MAG TPA: cytochrome c [Burkholderiales bacterium]|nr:cytochrome c [Burkholderiales bacterium]